MSKLSKLIVGKKESVQDDYLLLDPTQVPIINAIGFKEPVGNTTYEWVEDVMFPTKSAVSSNASDSVTSIVVDSVEPFAKDTVVKVGSELLLVTAVNTGTKTLTVERGYNGTTASAITSGQEIESLFVDSIEGQAAREARTKQRIKKANYTQIFTDTIEVSGTTEAIDQYGLVSEYERRRMKVQIEQFLALEKAIVQGVKFESASGEKRFMGGAKQYLVTNVADAAGAEITIEMLKDMTRKVNLAGGFKRGKLGYTFHMHPTMINKISNLNITSSMVQNREDTTRGYTVTHIQTDDGIFPVISNNNLGVTEVLFLDHARMTIHPLGNREFSHEYLGKTGDTFKGMVLGEYTFKFEEEKAHAWLKNIG